MNALTFGHSPDSDDAFMYYPLDPPEKIDTEGLHFKQILKYTFLKCFSCLLFI